MLPAPIPIFRDSVAVFADSMDDDGDKVSSFTPDGIADMTRLCDKKWGAKVIPSPAVKSTSSLSCGSSFAVESTGDSSNVVPIAEESTSGSSVIFPVDDDDDILVDDNGYYPFYDGKQWYYFSDDPCRELHALEDMKTPLVYGKEPISSLAVEFHSASPIIQEKIKLMDEQYVALRRTQSDGNCFFRSFMFSYLEHILETQDKAEADRVLAKMEQCKETLRSHGFIDLSFEDSFFTVLAQLGSLFHGHVDSISHDELLERCCNPSISDYVVKCFRFVTTAEIRRRLEFYKSFILGQSDNIVDQFCRTSVEPMGVESDHVHITALSDALGVAIRVVYLDSSRPEAGPLIVNRHDFIPRVPLDSKAEEDDSMMVANTTATENRSAEPFITLLYRAGHYDILYPKRD